MFKVFQTKQKSGINFLLDSFENIHSAESNLPLTAFIDLEHWTWNHQKENFCNSCFNVGWEANSHLKEN